MNPTFLTVEDILAIHEEQLAQFGGDEGIRDLTVLESAVAQPRAGIEGRFFCADLFEMAAA